jgi:hypothetical protein
MKGFFLALVLSFSAVACGDDDRPDYTDEEQIRVCIEEDFGTPIFTQDAYGKVVDFLGCKL